MTTVTLVVGKDTRIQDESGEKKTIEDLREGMRIDASASSRMTRSLPPQTAAYKIRIRKEKKYQTIKTRILMVDVRNHMLYTVSEDTKILSRRGMPIHLWNLRRGQFVRVRYGDVMTSSIPPQTAAYKIQVL